MKFAFIFPGQGSQSLGMLKDVAENNPEVKEYFAQASEALGYDLWDLVQNDQEKLSQTEFTQPALLTASYALFKIMERKYPQVKPVFMAGHSLGEYSALTCAGVLNFKDAVKLVQLRGKSMQEAVPDGGAMYAIIGLSDEAIIEACTKAAKETNEVVSAVNFNSPGQVVIAGTKTAAARAGELCKEAGAKRALPLAVSAPSHCSLMQPAADALSATFGALTLNNASIDVLHNVDLSVSKSKEEVIKALSQQLTSPVLWTQTVQKLVEAGVTHFVEVGPGKVLTGLHGRITKDAKCTAIGSEQALEDFAEFIA